METNKEDQRGSFVMEFLSGQWSMTELCERYRVSRPTGYKWLHRANEALRDSAIGLERPRAVPTARRRRSKIGSCVCGSSTGGARRS